MIISIRVTQEPEMPEDCVTLFLSQHSRFLCDFVYFLFTNLQSIIQKAEVNVIPTFPIDKIGFKRYDIGTNKNTRQMADVVLSFNKPFRWKGVDAYEANL